MRQNRISINDIKWDLIRIIEPWDGILENKPESEQVVLKLFKHYLGDMQKQHKIRYHDINEMYDDAQGFGRKPTDEGRVK